MKKILIQLDTDKAPSTFDRVVAVDAGVDELFSYGGIAPDNVTGLVHGAIFTRGPADLKNTAIFVGGGNVADGEALMAKIGSTFFGPMKVSVMMDSNGCNTTAAAAVVAAKKHLQLAEISALILGGTGPVGQRVAQLLAAEGSDVTLVSRSEDRAAVACDDIRKKTDAGTLTPAGSATVEEFQSLCSGKQLVVAAGAAGVCFLPEGSLEAMNGLAVAIDLNAVPPVGITDIDVTDRATEKHGTICYGAIGVGGTKMKVHRKAVASLFEANDRALDTEQIYALALQVAGLA
ncbi:MAG: bifunctional NADP-dependent methylenetetrahydromethanopterin dehydrogenase/methylenetetrahydrofolate dehydrogenase [Fuerstiella sp.]|nr:bifunctional NADP-dependent methylenetetrahydromethanopterin dehydrogenase/methylenetetrahydrofolate dehydrogenase [Fuerstiella sp.]MCP4855931.1 bifunctional NADP-dependent methylenetetrahydromethanopterin dehydrogenase/methylenetetrahydrofolate dehydrogenase [Fuerstiella sp.]